MAIDLKSAREIFLAAVEQHDSNDRSAFLDAACGDDQELRKHIDVLLQAHHQTGEFLEIDAFGDPKTNSNHADVLGSQIGPYKLLEVIGEGGMGTVYMAEQTEPVKRKVALKLIKTGMDTRQVIARFEAERQALALMDHPNIAKVFDAGATDSGSPYFVMELVKGKPITKFCDEQRLDTESRLKLFQQVCQAVQHAHQKGIIHRDLKPSNVMVAMYDNQAVPKVIDFGVAKATGDELAEQTMFTRFGQIVGTLEYMSPEQAQFNNLDIDTRSDIYSLGAILYELLAGEPPFEREKMKSQALDETLRMIREDEPTKPSAKLSSSLRIASVASSRSATPEKLSNQIRGELDWIVVKSLDKDRTRRYETASGLALDLERYLIKQPVSAMPPSTGYRLRKYALRNKVGLAFCLFAAAVLVSAFLVLLITNQLITKQRNDVAIALADSQKNLEKYKQAKITSEARAKQLVNSNRLLAGVFSDLNINDIRESSETVEQVLARRFSIAADQLPGVMHGDPLILAELQMDLGIALNSLGFSKSALELLESCRKTFENTLGPDDPRSLKSLIALCEAKLASGDISSAETQLKAAVEISNDRLGSTAKDTLEAMVMLGRAQMDAGHFNLSKETYLAAFRRSSDAYGEENELTLKITGWQAYLLLYSGEYESAAELFQQNIAAGKEVFGSENPYVLRWTRGIAKCYRKLERHDDAFDILNSLHQRMTNKLGASHPSSIMSITELGLTHIAAGNADKGLELTEEGFKLSLSRFGPLHPQTLLAKADFGWACVSARNYDRAVPILSETMEQLTEVLGKEHQATLVCMNNLALCYNSLSEPQKAIELLKQCLAIRSRANPDHPDTLKMMSSLGSALYQNTHVTQGIEMLEHALQRQQDLLGEDHLSTIATKANLASAYGRKSEFEKAIQINNDCLKLLEHKLPPDHHWPLSIKANLAVAYWRLNQLDDSIPLFESLLALKTDKWGADSLEALAAAANLGVNYKDDCRHDDAIKLLERVYRSKYGETPMLGWIAKPLAEAYVTSGRQEDAGQVVDSYEKLIRNKWSVDQVGDSEKLAADLTEICEIYFIPIRQYEAAERRLREALAIRQRIIPGQLPVARTAHCLGDSLAAQKKFIEAEKMLLSAYEVFVLQKTQLPARLAGIEDVIKSLIELYESWDLAEPDTGHSNSSDEWKRKLRNIEIVSNSPAEPESDKSNPDTVAVAGQQGEKSSDPGSPGGEKNGDPQEK